MIEKIIATADADLDDVADATAPKSLSLDAAVTGAEAAVAAAEEAVKSERSGERGGGGGDRDVGDGDVGDGDVGDGDVGDGDAGDGDVGDGESNEEEDGPVWPLHLFCRMEGCEYVYCGRLRRMAGSSTHALFIRPITFSFIRSLVQSRSRSFARLKA